MEEACASAWKAKEQPSIYILISEFAVEKIGCSQAFSSGAQATQTYSIDPFSSLPYAV